MTAARRAIEPLASDWGDALLVGPENGKGAWLAFGPENSWTGETHSATSES